VTAAPAALPGLEAILNPVQPIKAPPLRDDEELLLHLIFEGEV
jgi:hypothetical protein